jgi:hypothetical protein
MQSEGHANSWQYSVENKGFMLDRFTSVKRQAGFNIKIIFKKSVNLTTAQRSMRQSEIHRFRLLKKILIHAVKLQPVEFKRINTNWLSLTDAAVQFGEDFS